MRFIVTNRQFVKGNWTADRNPDGLSFWTCSSPAWQTSKNWQENQAVELITLLKGIGKPLIVFVHGFNNAWDKAEGTVSAIQEGLPDFQVVLFSWISAGEVLEYEQDRARARESATDLLNALILLKEVRLPHVLAHSMGNYVLQLAFDADDQPGQNPLLVDKLAMVAADVDNNVLDQDQAIARLTNKGMVFYSALDGALQDSTVLHAIEINGRPRLGLCGPSGHLPANFAEMDCTKQLVNWKDVLDPLKTHGAYFQEKFFYDALNQFFGKAKAAAS